MGDYDLIRPEMIRALRRYADEKIETGGFLRAVLENDLKGAVDAADWGNRAALSQFVIYCFNKIPAVSWGSPAKVEKWLEKGREERASHYGKAES